MKLLDFLQSPKNRLWVWVLLLLVLLIPVAIATLAPKTLLHNPLMWMLGFVLGAVVEVLVLLARGAFSPQPRITLGVIAMFLVGILAFILWATNPNRFEPFLIAFLMGTLYGLVFTQPPAPLVQPTGVKPSNKAAKKSKGKR